jgi:hypothetical protein
VVERISKELYLVVPVVAEDGNTIYVHGTPISRAVFETNYLVLARTFTALYSQGLGELSGPRVAAMVLRDVAKDLGTWEGQTGVEKGLMAEIKRLANVIVPGRADGAVPLVDAISQGLLDEDDASEVENALVYFTVASRMHKKTDREALLRGAATLWHAQISSLRCTEYSASLQTSTVTESSGETVAASSVPC